MHVPALKQRLARYALGPDKAFGQHFLCHAPTLQAIAQAVHGAKVLEIGPGPGVLTEHLIQPERHLVLVEKDRRLQPLLKDHFPQAQLIIQDALDLVWSAFYGFTVVSNLPYHVSVPLILAYIAHSACMGPAVFMMQKEVADKILAPPHTKSYGRLSVMVQAFAQPRLLVRVPSSAFWPMPSVQSSVLCLTPHATPLPVTFQDLSPVVEKCFAQRRKMLRHAHLMTDQAWQTTGIDPCLRAENLPVKAFVHLTQCLQVTKKQKTLT